MIQVCPIEDCGRNPGRASGHQSFLTLGGLEPQKGVKVASGTVSLETLSTRTFELCKAGQPVRFPIAKAPT